MPPIARSASTRARGRRGPVDRQLLTELHEALSQDTERGDRRLHTRQVVPDQPRRVDSGIETDADGVQSQPQTTERQHLIETDEVFLAPVTSDFEAVDLHCALWAVRATSADRAEQRLRLTAPSLSRS